MQSNDTSYTWHLSLRVDRPVEGCTMRPHAYMYSKRLDTNDKSSSLGPNTKISRDPIPNHEFSYRWVRGPLQETCAYSECPRRSSFAPHDWSKHALGGGCAIQCVSNQSSLHKAIFCNSYCFVQAWKTQYTLPKDGSNNGNYSNNFDRPFTPKRRGSASGSSLASGGYEDDTGSVGSYGSNMNENGSSNNKNPYLATPDKNQSFNDYGASQEAEYLAKEAEEWKEISCDAIYIPDGNDVGRKLKLECAAYSSDTGELLMHRVIKTDLVLSRAPDPEKRNLVTMKGGGGGGGATFRIVTYNLLAEIYATQQQYPYCDFWALNWDYRFQNIRREILDAHPDIICMQEVQADHYENHLYAALSEVGYEGVYKQKNSSIHGSCRESGWMCTLLETI